MVEFDGEIREKYNAIKNDYYKTIANLYVEWSVLSDTDPQKLLIKRLLDTNVKDYLEFVCNEDDDVLSTDDLIDIGGN